MNRVFYYSGHRLTVFHWDFKKFQGACSFEPDEDGLKKFKEYLQTSSKSPARLLVDVIEEDFRIETIPHVYGKDRKAVIDRLVDRYYRSSGEYVYSAIIGREKTGRKDSKILIGGITNPSLINIWKNIIDECQIPLIGTWALPLISSGILQLVSEKHGVVLLVSQQVNSNLRQTFFRDGKMVSSRQSVINQDAKNITSIGELASQEVERTLLYLRNQRLINPGEIVHIHVIGSDGQIESLVNEFKSDSLNEVKVHKISDLQEKLGLQGLSGKFSDGLFTWLCAKQLAFKANYGKAKDYTQYYYLLTSKALKIASVVVALAAILITESNISEAIEHKHSIKLLGEQAVEYKKIYEKKFEEYEAVFEHARSMNAAVDLADRIYSHSKISPLDFMIELSDVLSQSAMGVAHVDKIEWKLEQYQEGKQQIRTSYIDVTTMDPIRHVAVVYARIAISDKHYRDSVEQVNRIIEVLRRQKRIEAVEAIEMPVEVRSEKEFTDESGFNARQLARTEKGKFVLRITMAAKDE